MGERLNKKIAERIQIEAANRWDVDISDEVTLEWAPLLAPIIQKARAEFHREKRASKLYAERTGWFDEMEEAEFDDSFEIWKFLETKLGFYAYFDDDEKFVPSEYVQKHGTKKYLE